MNRFQGKYRVPSARLQEWDYASPGYYFVTICTRAQQPFFGEVREGVMHLSEMGEMIADEWLRTEQIRPNVTLDEWVVMPNHMHAILIINDVETPRRGVSTTTNDLNITESVPDQGISTTNNRRWKSGTLGAIINQFKSKCTKRIRSAGYPNFVWQVRYYDHIIRDRKSLDKIRAYIRGNPVTWEKDEYFSQPTSAR